VGIADDVAGEETLSAEARAARYRRERDVTAAVLGRTAEQLADAERLLEFHDAVAVADPHPPKWLTPRRPRQATGDCCPIPRIPTSTRW